MHKTLLKAVISLAALVFAFYNLQMADVSRVAGAIDWRLAAAAVGVTLVSVTLLGVRWRGLLAAFSAPKLSWAVSGHYIGLFGNNVFPLRLGEVIRTRYMAARLEVGFLEVLATVFLERLFDLVVVAGIAAVLLVGGTFAADLLGGDRLIVLAVAAVLSAPLVVWGFRPVAERLLARKFGYDAASTRWIGQLLHARTISTALVVSGLLWLAYACRYQSILLSLGMPADAELVALLIVATVVGFLVPAAPGAIGTYHLAVVFSMHNVYGAPLALAQVAAVMLHLSSYLPTTVIGFVLFIRSRIGPDATAAIPAEGAPEACTGGKEVASGTRKSS